MEQAVEVLKIKLREPKQPDVTPGDFKDHATPEMLDLFVEMVAKRKWQNGHLVKIAEQILTTKGVKWKSQKKQN